LSSRQLSTVYISSKVFLHDKFRLYSVAALMNDISENASYLVPKHKINKRLAWWWCEKHSLAAPCECDLRFEIVAKAFAHIPQSARQGTIPRYVTGGRSMSDLEMYVVFLTQCEAMFYCLGGKWNLRDAEHQIRDDRLLKMLTIVRESENWTPLPKMADNNTSLRDDPYPSVTHNILKLLLVWDLIELSCNTMTISERLSPDNVEYFQENVWQRSRLIPDVSLGRDDPSEDHEYVRRMRDGSIYNLVFGHRVVDGSICFNSVLTTSQVILLSS